MTPGFVGADLNSLVKEAGLVAVHRFISSRKKGIAEKILKGDAGSTEKKAENLAETEQDSSFGLGVDLTLSSIDMVDFCVEMQDFSIVCKEINQFEMHCLSLNYLSLTFFNG